MTHPRLILVASIALAAVAALTSTGQPGGSPIPRTEDDCTCPRPTVIADGCQGCYVAYRCVAALGDVFDRVVNEDESTFELLDASAVACNNCQEECRSMRCLQTLCVEVADQGSVTYNGSLSGTLKASVNTRLAGEIGIETTASFSVGTTDTTTISRNLCIECGAEGGIPPCRNITYRVHSLKRSGEAKIHVNYTWQSALHRVNPDGTRIRVSDWIGAPTVCRESFADIKGFKGYEGGCTALPNPCPPRDTDCRCPGFTGDAQPVP